MEGSFTIYVKDFFLTYNLAGHRNSESTPASQVCALENIPISRTSLCTLLIIAHGFTDLQVVSVLSHKYIIGHSFNLNGR